MRALRGRPNFGFGIVVSESPSWVPTVLVGVLGCKSERPSQVEMRPFGLKLSKVRKVTQQCRRSPRSSFLGCASETASVEPALMEGTLVVDKKPKAVWIDGANLKWGSSKGTTHKLQI